MISGKSVYSFSQVFQVQSRSSSLLMGLFDCHGVGVAWWVEWVWPWLNFFSLLWAVAVVVVVCVVVIVVYCSGYIILL